MNKNYLTVAMVFAILGLVGYLPYALMFLIVGLLGIEDVDFFMNMSVFVIVAGGLSAANIIAFIRLNKAKTNPKMRKEVLGWGIYLLIGGYLVGGIMGIIAANSNEEPEFTNRTNLTVEEKLMKLSNLYDKGLITQDEYKLRRKRIVEEI
ncbi:SHOCT domain-containing protein [Acholeplasma equirhinis]|uniref:SHOCT domain-containing protein n=1 Tax=Acholeplasma equirhinis TaxID=555393 RepID=UPI00197AC796|nr:SHOCT domain-containing protein [Acholeplasma equirhinis]MBN3491220.1 SHOCT domain-containing protein [Acholeplasma equirhinis]